MTSLNSDGIFDIPIQFKVTQDSFDTSLAHIEHWIAQLPMADAKICARELSEKLDEINRIEMSKQHRLKVLELFVSTVYKTTQTLKKIFIAQGLPLSDREYDATQQVEELNTHFAMGYKIYIEQSWASSVSILTRKKMTLVVYRAIFFLAETLMNAYESYKDPPSNCWHQIHLLYQYAQQKRLSAISLGHSEQHEVATGKDIISLYKKILLIGLISPYRLRQIITDKVYTALDSWSEYADIVEYEQGMGWVNCAIVNLHSDSPPEFKGSETPNSDVHTDFMLIDTSSLVEHLNEIILQRNNTQIFSANAADIPYNALKTLLITWSGNSKRAFSRANTQSTIGMTIGLSATHFFISNMEQDSSYTQSHMYESAKSMVWNNNPTQSEIDNHSDPELELPASFINPLNFQVDNNAIEQNIWDPEFVAKTVNNTYNFQQYKHELEQQSKKEEGVRYHPLHYNNINESASGLCLVGKIKRSDHVHKVRIGELVSICCSSDSGDEILNLGVIRRVLCTEDEIKLGIQKLAPCAEAIAACKFQQNRQIEQYSRSLVMPELKSINQPVTLVTNKLHSVDDRLILNKRGYKTVIKLTRLVESTDVFSQFEFSISHVLGYENKIAVKLELEEPPKTSEWSLL